MLYEMWSTKYTTELANCPSFFNNTPYDADLTYINDDLVGFFNSVPQTRLLDARHSFIHEWQNRHGEISITVDLTQKGVALESTFSASFRSPGFRHKSVSSADIFAIVQASLGTHFHRLELVDDNLLLGFYVDIYKLPDIRQIRDNVSAGTLRSRLSI